MSNLNLNKAIIGGRLVTDPELKKTQGGISVTTFSIAINRRKGTDTVTDFVDCVAWKETAEFICKYFRKGSGICVIGFISKRGYEKNGEKRYTTEIIINEALFVDSKNENTVAGAPVADTSYADLRNDEPAFGGQMEELREDDDLPF